MLTDAPVTVILPVVDMARACRFYESTLQLRPAGTNDEGQHLYRVAGTLLALHHKPGGTKADHTAITFEVHGLEREIAELKARGIVFEDYDFPGLKTVNHIATFGRTRMAWFKDSEGNYLCVHENG